MATHSSIPAWKIPWTNAAGYIPWGPKELDTTERVDNHSSLWSVHARVQSLVRVCSLELQC